MNKKLASLLAACLLAMASPASAHTAVADSSPEDGSSRKNAPSRVWVSFGQEGQAIPGAIQGGTLKVINPCGKKVHTGETDINETMDRLTRSMSSGKKGAYKIKWFAIASDGAEQQGTLDFKVTTGKSC